MSLDCPWFFGRFFCFFIGVGVFCVLCPILPMSMNCPVVTDPLVFFNVYSPPTV